jgi:uncharacterized protein
VNRRPVKPPAAYGTVRSTELQVSVFVRTGDRCGGRPLYREILDRARAAGLSGATVVRGLEGFGASGKLSPPGFAGLRGTEPVLIEITDDDAVVRAFLPVLDQLIGSGLVLLKPVIATRRCESSLAPAAVGAPHSCRKSGAPV